MKLNIFFLLIIAFLSSCNQEDDQMSDPVTGTMSAIIDGDAFEITFPTGTINEVENPDPNGEPFYGLAIGGVVGENLFSTLTINVIDEIIPSVGEYVYSETCFLTGDLCAFILYIQDSMDEDADPFDIGGNTSVTINFTEVDYSVGGRVKGTFSGNLYTSANEFVSEITSGQFDVIIGE